MLKYIIAMTSAGLPIALLLGLFAAFVRDAYGPGRKTSLWWGLALGAASAVMLVILKKSTGFVVREYYNLALLLPMLAVAATLFVVALRGSLRPWTRWLAVAALALWMAYYLPYPLFFPFDFHVGMDSVFTTRYAAKVMGWSLGAGLLLLAFLATRHMTKALSARTARCFFAAGVTLMAASQFIAAAQIALARGYLPRRPGVVRAALAAIGFSEDGGFLFAMALLVAILAATAWLATRRVSLEAANVALSRKIKAAVRHARRWCSAAVAVLAVMLLSVTVGSAYENQEVVFEPPKEAAVRDGAVRLPLDGISGGRLHRFVHRAADGAAIRYIVIKKNATAFGVGLDACDVCGPSGYYERKDQVVCILCDVVMNKSTIGFPGGCNPVPLAFHIAEGEMIIDLKDLEAGAWRFKGDYVYQLPSAPAKE